MKGKKQYIFVHGLSGWGSYDKAYERMPYWGMQGGLMHKHDVRAFYVKLLSMIDRLP